MRLWAKPGMVVLLVSVLETSGCKPEEAGSGTVEVRGALAVAPGDVVFAPVALGQFRDQRVRFKNTSRLPVTVSRLSTSLASATVLGGGGFTLAPAEEREVVVRFAPAVEGEVTGRLVAETDLPGGAQRLHVPLRGVGVLSYVDIQPKGLDFGWMELDTVKVLSVEAHNPTEVDAHFTLSLEGEDADQFSSPEASRQVRVGPGETHHVSIAFRPLRLGLTQATASFTRCSICTPEELSLTGEGGARLLDILPTRLEYGRVALGARAEQRVTLRNHGNEAVTLLRAWTEGAEGSYSVANPPPRTILRQGQSVDIAVAFQPPLPGLHKGLLRLEVQEGSAPARRYTVALTGVGGTTCVTLLPRTMDFGAVPEGMSLTRKVYAFNTCQEDVTLTGMAVRTTQGGAFSLATPVSSLEVPKGGEAPIPVTFTPKAGGGSSEGRLTVHVHQGSGMGADSVALQGSGRVFAPCQYRVDPAALSFGQVQVGSAVTLGAALTNVGTDDCFVSGVELAWGSDSSFSTEGFEGGVLSPGARSVFRVRFSPSAMGSFSGRVEGEVNQGRITLPVSGEGVQSCLTLEPGTVDFGTLKLGCGAPQRQVVAVNQCNTPVTLTAAVLDGATSGALHVADAPHLPFVLGPGQQAAFTLAYAPTNEGEDTAAFRVTTREQGPLTVGLRGRGLRAPRQSDRFVQVALGKVDVLFVIDNSASMMEEQQGLSQNFAAFMSAALGGGIDYHIGVTTTGIHPSPPSVLVCNGGVNGGEAGRLFPVDGSAPRILTPSTPNAAAVFAHNTQVGVCPQKERGLEAAYRALSPPLVDSVDDPRTPLPNDGNAGFLRPEARLALVFVSDEEDASEQPLAFYEAFFRALKGNDPNMLTISAIIGPPALSTCPTAASSGTRYLALAQATGGGVESICTADWARSLKKLSDETFELKRRFQLSHRPVDPGQLSVTIDGVPALSGWSYSPASNSVDFAQGSAPPAGALVEVSYPLGC